MFPQPSSLRFIQLASRLRYKTIPTITGHKRYEDFNISCFRNFHQTTSSFGVTPIKMPSLSPTMTEGTIVKWMKQEGDKISPGDVLCEIQTDKAVVSLEYDEEGILAKLLKPENSSDVKIGTPIALVVDEGDDWKNVEIPKDLELDTSASVPAASHAQNVSPPVADVPASTSASSGHLIGPAVRNLLLQYGLNPSQVPASGAHKNLLKGDILRQVTEQKKQPGQTKQTKSESSSSYVDRPISNNAMINRLVQSKKTIPHYQLTSEIEVDTILQLRAQFNAQQSKDSVKLTVHDFVIKAAAMACRKVPEVNSSWMDNVIRQYNQVDVSIGVSTDSGLMGPIVFGAERKGVVEIATTVKELATRARAGKLQPHEFQGGTFSVSNLGMYGIHHFSAIINPPQSCLLAVGGTTQKMVMADTAKGYKNVTVIDITLNCDHRVVDGAVGSEWLRHFKSFLSNPAAMLL